jgi:signal transduction histidine kinase
MKNRIIILSIFIFLVSILIIVNVVFHESLHDELADQYNKQQLLIAKAVADSIYASIEHLEEESESLARLLAIRGLHNGEGLTKFITTAFEEIGMEMDVGLTVLDREGSTVYSSMDFTSMTGDYASLYKSSRDLKEGEVLFLERIKNEDKRLLMTTPVIKSGIMIGSLLLNISIDDINEKYLAPIKLGKRGYAWMIDKTGTLIYHPTQSGMIGNNLYSAEKKCFSCHTSVALEKKVLEGPVEYGRYVAPTGEDKVLAFSRMNIGNTQWIVCVSSPYSEVTSITGRSNKLYSGLVVAIFATVFLGASVIVLNNRQRVKTEIESKEAIVLEKQKLDTIVSAIGSGLMLLDRNNKIQWINKTLREWAGNVEGSECDIICPAPSAQDSFRDITHDTHEALFGKKGHIFQITSAPVKGSDGNIKGMLKLIQDVTDVKQLEESILRSEKLAALGRVAAGIAHEIGNPLTSISSFVQILKEKVDDDFSKESLETIHHHILRISNIVSQMSRLSKLPTMNLRQCNINQILESSMEIVKYDEKLSHVDVVKELSDDLPPVYVDENYLSQVFINLILNAADAIKHEEGSITVKSMLDNHAVVVQFLDTGTGIPPEDLGKVFDPFFTTKEKGSGLGLSTSYEVVKRFDGELKVESQENVGSIFSIILPVKDVI